jgi:hypothetical protein
MFRLDQILELGDVELTHFEEGRSFPARFLSDLAYPTLGVQELAECSTSTQARCGLPPPSQRPRSRHISPCLT